MMRLARNKTFWIFLATGSAFGAALIAMKRRTSSYGRPGIPHGYRTRVAGDRARVRTWRFDHSFPTLAAGSTLRIETLMPSVVHWTVNQWDSVEDTHTTEIAAGTHVADLSTEMLKPGTRVQFTFYWPAVNRWEGQDFELRIGLAAATAEGSPD
jgi:hypothetical protein